MFICFGVVNIMYYFEIIVMFVEIINLKIKNMLIYNIIFQVDDEVYDNFLIWIKESYIFEVEKYGVFCVLCICCVLSYCDEGIFYLF